jgi:hypothetical protein
LALSQAPPELDIEIATWTPETIPPANRPQTALGPKRNPAARGESRTRAPGATIDLIDVSVDILIHLS